MKTRPEIDGLRAIAVLPVLFFHADLGFPGGYVGVDVFFVISGFLITSLIVRDIEGGSFSMVQFWERRVRRILPALAVVVLVTLVAGWWLLLVTDFEDLARSVVSQGTLLSNVYFWRESGYFAGPADVKPLLHTWSLAVEEQFYLFFPGLLVLSTRLAPRGRARTILLAGIASFLLSVYGTYTSPSATFYLLPTRAWELLVGSLLALRPARQGSAHWVNETLAWAGLVSILAATLLYDRNTRFPGVAALMPCFGAASIIWANGPALTSAGRLLATTPIVFVGLISYSLYLWHWPIFALARYWALGPIPVGYRVLMLLGIFVLAYLSWRFVETPFRNRAVAASRASIFAFAGSTAALFLAGGLAVLWGHGFPARMPPEVERYAEGRSDRAFLNEVTLKDVSAENFVELGAQPGQKTIHLLVWGDSHAMAVMPALDALCKAHSVRGVAATHSDTAPLVGFLSRGEYSLHADSIPFNDRIIDFIRNQQIRDVLLVARWVGYASRDYGEDALGGVRRGLIATIASLRSAGARTWILRTVPEQPWDVPRALSAAALFGGAPQSMGLPLADHLRHARREAAVFEGLEGTDVVILDPTELLTGGGDRCLVAAAGIALYSDQQHLSVHGAMLLSPLFDPIFASEGKPAPGAAN